MADQGDTAALCNDTKTHIPYDPGQPTDPDIEAGSVIGEEPTSHEEIAEGEEVEGEEGEAAVAGCEEEPKGESKVPFIYMIVEPGCTPLSCYSAIITFFIMTCGVFWLLLISPPINARAFETRMPWLTANETSGAVANGTGDAVPPDLAPMVGAIGMSPLDAEHLSGSSLPSSAVGSSTTVLPLDPDGPPNQT